MRTLAWALLLAASACKKSNPPAPRPQLDCSQVTDWTQVGRSSTHVGTVCAQGRALTPTGAPVVIDPFLAQEQAEEDGNLLAHFQAPLVSGDDVYMAVKGGAYTSCNPPGSQQPFPCGPDAWASQSWGVKHFRWQNGTLGEVGTAQSDWKPPPNRGSSSSTASLGGWEPLFHAVLAGGMLWMPGAGGSVIQVDAAGTPKRVDPFADPDVFVSGPLTATPAGELLYTAVRLQRADPWGDSAGDPQAWLVRISAAGTATKVDFAGLVPGAPAPTDPSCEVGYAIDPRNPPPLPLLLPDGSIAPPPMVRCGPQRPPLNAAPAVRADGTIFLVSRAHGSGRYAFVVAVKPDLSPLWATSLRGALGDGCGVTVLADGQPGHCVRGVPLGIDPSTGRSPAGRASDQGTSSPVVLPDGGVLYGAFTSYNGSRGHLFKLGVDGRVLATYDFGWDITPAVFPHDGTYSIVTKDNFYDQGPFFITQLDANLRPQWAYRSQNQESCQRGANGQISCVKDHPGGFEWCVSAVAVDQDGVVYANSEDGNLYAISPGGEVKERVFLQLALGAAYTPITLDAKGRLYAQNGGQLFMLGGP